MLLLPEGMMCACLETGVRASGARGGLLDLRRLFLGDGGMKDPA
jgi:hypothetical protein